MNTDAASVQAVIGELFDELLEARADVRKARAKFSDHRQVPRPEFKFAYDSFSEYISDVSATERWDERRHYLDSRVEQARKWEGEITTQLHEHLPLNPWFKHGPLAIALAAEYEDDPAPFATVEPWSDSLPDLRNGDHFVRYMANISHA
jgi:hypothetical protein